ncbi:MAG: hypothetical protein KAG66_17445, partial [Methylococcales bacterium]|nr:hypothetical protein [Methylococcales bacterium]
MSIHRHLSMRIPLALVSSLILASCGGSGGDSGNESVDFDSPQPQQPVASDDATLPVEVVRDIVATEDVHPYRPDGPYAAVLKHCTLVNTIEDSCTMQTLPFIGHDSEVPDTDDILDRLLVTHDWMGDRFAEVVQAAPELTVLFASVTSIIIGSEVRPSGYSPYFGGMILDPGYLWQSVEEKLSVSIEEDYRSGFGDELGFESRRAFTINGEFAYRRGSLNDNLTREFEDVLLSTVRLLYHELAHANDVFPPTTIAELDRSLQVTPAFDQIGGERLSWQLEALYPLNDSLLHSLQAVRSNGDDATEDEKLLTAAEVGQLFSEDGAASFYSYRNSVEDFAVLFATTMMKLAHGVQTNVGFVDKIDGEPGYCDYLTAWGVRNRLANPVVAQRAHWVVTQIYGESEEFNQFMLNDLGMEETMLAGVGWCANVRPESVELDGGLDL